MKYIHYILIIILVSFETISCKKEPENKTSYLYLSKSIKPYKFKNDTYWIFKNDSTGTIDSIVVINTESDFKWSVPPIHGQHGTKSEYYKIEMKNFSTSQTFNNYLTSYYIKRNGGGEFGEDGQPIFMAERDTGSKFNGMEIVAKFKKFKINENTFYNIVETKITASQQYQPVFTNDTYLYFSDSIGIIKKVIDLGNENYESWSVIRWNVIK